MARSRPRIENHHAEWLSLVETSGPFLTVPALKRALPDGLEATPPGMSDLRIAHSEWRQDSGLQRRWVRWVLDGLLGLRDAVEEANESSPAHLVAEQGVTLRPSYVVRDRTGAGEPAVLLVHEVDFDVALDRPLRDQAWAASPIDRAAELARASGVPLVLVTNGARWTLVWARMGETTGICTWRTELWLEEELTLRAFVTLLGAKRFFNLPPEEGLAELLQESAGKQQEVADQLGAQVRRAVELLIATLDYVDRDRHGELLGDLDSAEVYRGATTVMMRLVFLFVAEERRLLPLDNPRYAETLAASTLRAQLQERADRYGEDPLERSTAAWHRVLALFRAVHGGIEHDELRLPAYGGGLFDPDRYPFLEGRPPGTSWRETAAQPLPVDDRTMLHLLDALQTLEQGSARVLLSYRALDVEQIGHVYEGLLDHTAMRLSDAALALGGKEEPELALGVVEDWAAAGEETLAANLAKECGRSAKAVAKALSAELPEDRRSRLRAACGGDDALYERVAPFHALLRDDLRGDPLVILPDSLFVTQALDRRASGTYYTPRQLAEEVVQFALEPIVYRPGPAEESDRTKWKLKPAAELLDLKVADIAMGSGAFLVAACRFLAARLLEAWGAGSKSAGDPVPADPIEREALAHRLVAERCLYGVDKNPMAVEMAKLSLWLITLAKDRPFSFVDHALRTGDSLLGITDLRQLKVAHLDPDWPRQSSLDLGFGEIEAAVDRAQQLRTDLEDFVVRDIADAERKKTLLAEADVALDDSRLLGDLIVGAALTRSEDGDPLAANDIARLVRTMLDTEVGPDKRDAARTDLRAISEEWLVEYRPAVAEVEEVEWADRDPFHWAIEFPEVFSRGGLDAIVGNPPFQGGQKISGSLGDRYREFLVLWLASGVRGSSDLVAYFYLRAATLLREGGGFGLIATNTLAQGDTREVGLDQLKEMGWTIDRAIASEPWPGGANLEMATVWSRRGSWASPIMLDRSEVSGIAPSLSIQGRVAGNAHRLAANRGLSFQGSNLLGMGFVLTPEQAKEMLVADGRNAEVVKPYLVGEDLNQQPDGAPSRWVIDFRDWSKECACTYRLPFAHVEDDVRPERQKSNDRLARNNWWRFTRPRVELYKQLQGNNRCISITITSKTVQPMLVPTGVVFGHKLVVFALDGDADFGVLSSNVHREWAIARGSTMRVDPNYSPSDCFETLAQPPLTKEIDRLGNQLNSHRSALMLDRQEGLTTTYNRVHNPDEHADDIVRLREIHVELDYAVRDAYGWDDLGLGHGFHETKFGVRYTFAPLPRQEVLDRLLELNHERYAEEVRQGLHDKAKAKRKPKAVAPGTMTLELGDE
jgi:hypothetical protein